MTTSKRWLALALGLGLALGAAACKAKVEGPVKLVKVAGETVCMSNNYFMGGPQQTPVALDGKTYFVCCEGCRTTLTKHPKDRVAKDPVSGKPVDKSVAAIGKLPNNNILYFENEANLMAYVVPTPTPEVPHAAE